MALDRYGKCTSSHLTSIGRSYTPYIPVSDGQISENDLDADGHVVDVDRQLARFSSNEATTGLPTGYMDMIYDPAHGDALAVTMYPDRELHLYNLDQPHTPDPPEWFAARSDGDVHTFEISVDLFVGLDGNVSAVNIAAQIY